MGKKGMKKAELTATTIVITIVILVFLVLGVIVITTANKQNISIFDYLKDLFRLNR